jgi:DNA-directed RNA polymerase specialized sigma24 family protein
MTHHGRPYDPTPLTDAQRDLARRYWPMALRRAKRAARARPGLADELLSAYADALVVAARGYRPERGVNFATYLERRLWCAYRLTIKAAKRHEGVPCREGAYGASPYELALDDPPAPIETAEAAATFARLVGGPERERRYAVLVYAEGLKAGEAAEVMGVSKGVAGKIASAIAARVRVLATAEGW